jgi:hypothetical protein
MRTLVRLLRLLRGQRRGSHSEVTSGFEHANRIANPMLAAPESGPRLDSLRRSDLSAPILPRFTLKRTCAPHTPSATVRGLIYTRRKCYG